MLDNRVSIFFIVLIPFLLFIYIHQRKQIQKINEVIEEIQQGKTNQRFRVQPMDQIMSQLSSNLNIILDQLQVTAERSQYLEEAWKQMVSNLTHDLSVPLTSMLSYLELLTTDQSLTTQERQEFVKLLAVKGDQLAGRLENFMELARVEGDTRQMKLKQVNLTELLQEVLVSFYQEFVQVGITPEILLPGKPLFVWGDAAAIEKILHNLVSNAVQYGKDAGAIGIRAWEEQDQIGVEIWDKAQGIAAQDLPYFFEKIQVNGYAQAQEAVTQGGSGIDSGGRID